MSSIQWRNGFAFGLIVGIGLTLVLFFFADETQDFVESDQLEACPTSEDCKIEAREFENEQNSITYWARRFVSYEDTSAQWVMLLFTIVAAILLWRTLVATREIGANQLRPWMVCKELEVAPSLQTRMPDGNVTPNALTFRAVWKNAGGASPAIHARLQMEFLVIDINEEPPMFTLPVSSGPVAIESGGQRVTSYGAIDATEVERLSAGTHKLIVYTRADYFFGSEPIKQGHSECTLAVTQNGFLSAEEGKKLRPRYMQEYVGTQNSIT